MLFVARPSDPKNLRQQTCEHEFAQKCAQKCVYQALSMLTLGDFPVYLLSVHASFLCSFIITSDSTLCARLLESNELSSNIDRRELLTCKSQGRRAYHGLSTIVSYHQERTRKTFIVRGKTISTIHTCMLSVFQRLQYLFPESGFSSFSYPSKWMIQRPKQLT